MNNKQRVLLQLSGGKDSIACLLCLKKEYTKVDAIMFVHKYSYDIPTKMSKMVCEQLKIKLHIIDISNDIELLFLNHFSARPCRYCKAIMDKVTVDFAKNNKYDIICVGDTADDSMLINRIIAYDGRVSKFSRYLNAHVTLPSNIIIYRPLIDKTSSYTLELVTARFPFFTRVNDTGDKYFEYSREGCPLQFKDLGVFYTKELMSKLKHMNSLCSDFATQKGIRATIHLPSEFIVTIPEGYENECRSYLIGKGCKLNNPIPSDDIIYVVNISIRIDSKVYSYTFFRMAILRFLERINVPSEFTKVNDNNIEIENSQIIFKASYTETLAIVNIDIYSTIDDINNLNYKNICLEIFHTNNIAINHSVLK